ncbi:MAG: SusC/RagA family TonB-linked outer membrane protein [Prevotella sp.]|nr:SusC/RagA family TonB-linked outer membrane protein [Prevotella sp.]
MKRHHILSIGILLALGVSTAYAQDEDEVVYAEGAQQETVVKKPVPVKKQPQYPMKEVKGVVVDAATKAPLAGVQVQTLNDNRFTAMTNAQGEFTISVPTFATSLFVHTAQYLSQQVGIGQDADLHIVMIADKFGAMYENGTNVLAAPVAKINNTTATTVENEIENILGADIHAINRSGGPGYGAAMFIRGLNSLNANAQPLIVVDGIVRDMQQTRMGLHDGDFNNLLLNINPEDIDNVQILKNGTALYGAKGGNGVILITTKRGRSMATRIDANIGVGVSLQPRLPEVMNASQYRLYASELLGTYPNVNNYDIKYNFLNDDPNGYYYNMYHNETDWTKEVYRTALTQNYNINVQGGDDVGMYNLSLGYTDAQSTARKNGFNRLNVRFNTDINVIGNLSTRFDMAFAKINRNVFDDGAAEDLTAGPVASPTFLSLIKSPFLNPYTYYASTGKLSSTLSQADDYLVRLDPTITLGNPTALLEYGEAVNKNRVENTEFYAVIAPRYEFSKNLVLSETFNYTLNRVSQRYYRPIYGMPEFLIDGVGTVQRLIMSMFSKETSVMSDTRLSFNKHFGAHYLNAFGGMRFSSFAYDDNQPEAQDDKGGNDKQPNISASSKYKRALGTSDSWRSITWYANADYNYRNLYFLQATVAMESNSRFGENADGLSLAGVKWGIFPSIQAGWAITNEKWFPKTHAVNYLLLRAGYDISGNDDISNYAARTSFNSVQYLDRSTAAQLNNIGNDKIQWEQTNKINVGLKSYWLNNRLGVDFDYYINHTSNLLTLKSFDNPVAGINNYWSNGGSLDNTGFELSVTGKPIISKSLNVEVGASMGHYVNKVKSLPNNNRIYLNGAQTVQGYTSSIYGTNNIATIVGESVGSFYGFKTAGVFATDAEAKNAAGGDYLYSIDKTGTKIPFVAGDMHFQDLNGDGIISDADKTIIGNPNPDIYGNIFANVMWKNFTLYVGFNYSLGNDVFNYQRSLLEGGNNFYNQTVAMTNRWRYNGQQTDIPRIAYEDPQGNSRFSDRWIEDGSYLRLKTVRLNYKVPVPSNWSWLQGLAFWAEANNVFTITHYLGSDPEFSVANGVLYQGIDAGNVALGRTFTFGMRINL